jgi:hypothetical protein
MMMPPNDAAMLASASARTWPACSEQPCLGMADHASTTFDAGSSAVIVGHSLSLTP